MLILILASVAAALLLGAVWGAYGRLSATTEGFLMALAGGALIVAVMDDLIAPALSHAPLWSVLAAFGAGAIVFTAANAGIAAYCSSDNRRGGGMGLLLAIVLDGMPENLALGVTLIDTTAAQAAVPPPLWACGALRQRSSHWRRLPETHCYPKHRRPRWRRSTPWPQARSSPASQQKCSLKRSGKITTGPE
jgi:zinc transporter ZupT